MKSTCVPLRPYYTERCGWLFELIPPWQGTSWKRPLRYVIVHGSLNYRIRVCKAMYTGQDRTQDWGSPLPRVEAQRFFDTYFDEIRAVMDVGGKP